MLKPRLWTYLNISIAQQYSAWIVDETLGFKLNASLTAVVNVSWHMKCDDHQSQGGVTAGTQVWAQLCWP